MKAITVKEPGSADVLQYTDVDKPKPGPKELLIRVGAIGLNRIDIHMREAVYRLPNMASPILGVEASGTVEACGSEVTKYKVGDKVFGYIPGGCYAEYCLEDEGLALPLPANWDFVQGAAVAEVFQTANEAIFTYGHLQTGQTLLMNAGASGVGLAGIQMAKHKGAKVIVTVSTDEKVEHCKSLGADLAINYKSQDFVKEVLKFTDNEGVDLIVDSVGPAYFDQNFDCIKRGGIIIAIGLLTGTKGEFDLSKLIRKTVRFEGHSTSSRDMEDKHKIVERFKQQWLPALENGDIKPNIDKIFEFDEMKQAHEYMEANKNIGKIVVRGC